jgi:signal recognition particle GTPase
VDTAGRLGIDEALMQEIKTLHANLNPIETLFVVDAMLGQDAVNTAKAFHEALPLTGVILTKLDGDSRGGAALSVRQVTGVPLKFIGVAEKMDGLEAFDAERMASRILGMGDILALVEQAQQNVDVAKAEKLASKISKGGFDLGDFRDQLAQMQQMGGMASLMDKLPSHMAQAASKTNMSAADKQTKRMRGIIDSMTPKERAKPELLKATRKRRIAAGALVKDAIGVIEFVCLGGRDDLKEFVNAFYTADLRGCGSSEIALTLGDQAHQIHHTAVCRDNNGARRNLVGGGQRCHDFRGDPGVVAEFTKRGGLFDDVDLIGH